jgi:predicted NBD/HSP70 family sugar kinase
MVAAAAVSGTEELRRTNLRAVLSAVHTQGPLTRAELTRLLGLNRSTIGGLTAALIDLGLVAERTAAGAASGGVRSGRPSHLVVPRPENAVVAVDLGVDRVQVALVGLGGTVLNRRTRPHERGEHDVRHVVERVAAMVEDMLAATPPQRFLGVAASVPGAVRRQDGMVQFAPNLGWHGAPFTEMLSERLGRDVRAGNDANLGVIAEHLRGAAVDRQHVIYLSASVGIGGGFLVNGVLLEGASGYAGEIGHLQVDASGPECRCGAIGCWELKVGENRLLTLAGREPGGGPDAVAEVIRAADAGERAATEAIDEVAEWTGVGLRSLINVFNPEVIVLGGTLAQLWGCAAERVEAVLGRRALLAPRTGVAVLPAKLGQDSSLLGAAELAFESVLADPQCVAASWLR